MGCMAEAGQTGAASPSPSAPVSVIVTITESHIELSKMKPRLIAPRLGSNRTSWLSGWGVCAEGFRQELDQGGQRLGAGRSVPSGISIPAVDPLIPPSPLSGVEAPHPPPARSPENRLTQDHTWSGVEGGSNTLMMKETHCSPIGSCEGHPAQGSADRVAATVLQADVTSPACPSFPGRLQFS